MDIDRDAPATAQGEIQITASPETVWAVMADLRGWPTWHADVKSMDVDGRLEPGTTFRWKSGSASLVSTLQAVEEPREIGWTGKTMGIHAVHVFTFEPMDGGTHARSAESFRGLIPSIFRQYSRNVLQRGIDGMLRSLKAEAERRSAAANA
ncbi:MAG: SRPBCC family protein [Actinomycetota bacterium]|nr:SRPBCC family protein [Actinomycetota bacterium]MDH5225194.1 SRPBCC family protein [Actinomycetota bacterium]